MRVAIDEIGTWAIYQDGCNVPYYLCDDQEAALRILNAVRDTEGLEKLIDQEDQESLAVLDQIICRWTLMPIEVWWRDYKLREEAARQRLEATKSD